MLYKIYGGGENVLRVERVEEEEQVKRVHMEHKNGKKFLCLCCLEDYHRLGDCEERAKCMSFVRWWWGMGGK